jgi:hypothetical protein
MMIKRDMHHPPRTIAGLAAWLVLFACAPKDASTDGDTDASTGAATESATSMPTSTPTTSATATATDSGTTAATDAATTSAELTCEDARAAAQAFVESHKTCESDSDCTAYMSFCYSQTVCGSVAVNKDHDPKEAMQLFDALEDLCDDCGADPCGAGLRCVDKICTLSVEF